MLLNYTCHKFSVVFREFGKLFQIIGAIYEILFWPWLVFRNGWFNFSKDALVVVLGWLAGLNMSFINDIELLNCSKWSFSGSQLILFKFISSYMSSFIQIQTELHAFTLRYLKFWLVKCFVKVGVPSWTRVIEMGLY